MMRVLLTGANGQVGHAVRRQASVQGIEVIALDHHALDITNATHVEHAIERHRPTHIINAAAYTDVNRAETEQAQAFAVNRDGAANLATAATRHGCRLIHLSTDYVFDGISTRPYRPNDPTNPLNIYGASKRAGELAIEGSALVIRTAWIYSNGGRNFVTTMRKLLQERDEVKVVDDQLGSPTSADSIARVILSQLDSDTTGIQHWVDDGETTWYGFATEIAKRINAKATVIPITTEEFPTPAKRPRYSVLARTLGGNPNTWKEELQKVLDASG